MRVINKMLIAGVYLVEDSYKTWALLVCMYYREYKTRYHL